MKNRNNVVSINMISFKMKTNKGREVFIIEKKYESIKFMNGNIECL